MSNAQNRQPSGDRGYFLMALGGMITLLCGGCTLAFVRSSAELSQMGYVFGGVPTLIGVAMFLNGFMRYRRGRK